MIIRNISQYCTELLTTSKCRQLPFHNLEHTKEVAQNVNYLCTAMDVDPKQTNLLIIAAWFHDTGFSTCYNGHEESSQKIATDFLVKEGFSQIDINSVCNCIEATKMPQNPTTVIAEILCDADIFHISNSHFFYRKLLLRREWEIFCNKKVSDLDWHKMNLEFLKKHHFRTVYGKGVLEKGKQKNINKVERILAYYDY